MDILFNVPNLGFGVRTVPSLPMRGQIVKKYNSSLSIRQKVYFLKYVVQKFSFFPNSKPIRFSVKTTNFTQGELKGKTLCSQKGVEFVTDWQ